MLHSYLKTHPWLRFSFDSNRLNYRVWMLLGEACSKCEHIAFAPLHPEQAQELYRVYLAKGVAGTTAIEGNTLSEEEVRLHLEGRLKLPPSKEYLGREVGNILNAANFIATELLGGDECGGGLLSASRIAQYNRTVLEGLEHDDDVTPGAIRTHSVTVLRYRGAPAQDCEYLMDRMCEWLNGEAFRPSQDRMQRMTWGILRAILAHLYIAWIHPFGDGNGRTARLVELQVLLDACVPQPAAHLLSNHYNLTRSEYYRQLDYASKSGGDVTQFIEYALVGLVDGLKEQLHVIRDYQWDVAWRDFIFRTFGSGGNAGDDRRREVALALSGATSPVPALQVPNLNVRLAREYATKAEKTLLRDLKILQEMNLVKRVAGGYEANREIILSFLPPRRPMDESE